MATSAMPKPVSPMTKLATKTTRAPAAQARVTAAIIAEVARRSTARSLATDLQPGPQGGAALLKLGYKLSSEEFASNDLVHLAARRRHRGHLSHHARASHAGGASRRHLRGDDGGAPARTS